MNPTSLTGARDAEMLGPRSHMVVDDFLPRELASQLRRAADEHFGHPGRHAPATHMIWNYWFVPDHYAYLRTEPMRVFGTPLSQAFHAALSTWAAGHLGLGQVTWPFLSLYVDGCQQELHNDAANGRFGFVYSLTRDDRRSTGGETLVMHEDNAYRTAAGRPAAGPDFYELIAPRFNRLIIFDDRVPHAVRRVEGTMDPREGRLALHGHIREGGPIVSGGLSSEEVERLASGEVGAWVESLGPDAASVHGVAVLRFVIATDGGVSGLETPVCRVLQLEGATSDGARLLESLLVRISALTFSRSDRPTTVTYPVVFGPSMRGGSPD